MKKRPLGNTGIMVSEISFGCVEIGLPYGAHKTMLAEDEAISLLNAAFEGGINFFDTARMYGVSEDRIGKAFKNVRGSIVICTKCPHLRDADKKMLTGRALCDHIERSITESLNALGTDYVDVYLAHSVDSEILRNPEVADIFCDLKRRGLVKAVGVSTYAYNDSILAIEDGRWNVIQFAFNLMDQSGADLFPAVRKHGVGIMARSVLMRGILTDKEVDLSHEKLKPIALHRNKYYELLDGNIKSLSDLATRFVLSFDDVSSVLVGIDKPEFLENALKVATGSYLDNEMLARVRELAYPDPAFLDLAMWDRNGWTK